MSTVSTPAPSETDSVGIPDKKRTRSNFVRSTKEQRSLLQQAFAQSNQAPLGETLDQLAKDTQLTKKWILAWFGRERRKKGIAVKREYDAELVALSEAEFSDASQAHLKPFPSKKSRITVSPFTSTDSSFEIKQELLDPFLNNHSLDTSLPGSALSSLTNPIASIISETSTLTRIETVPVQKPTKKRRRKRPIDVASVISVLEAEASSDSAQPVEHATKVPGNQGFITIKHEESASQLPTATPLAASENNTPLITNVSTSLPTQSHSQISHITLPVPYQDSHAQPSYAGVHFQRRLRPIPNTRSSPQVELLTRMVQTVSGGSERALHAASGFSSRVPSSVLQSASTTHSSYKRIQPALYPDVKISPQLIPSFAYTQRVYQSENNPAVAIRPVGPETSRASSPQPQPPCYTLPRPMNDQLTPMKHLTILQTKFQGRTTPVPSDEVMGCLLDEQLTKDDPFQAAMGLVFLTRSGLCSL
ncbi:hypothetical protein Moror_4011 [Moniliophthora roreri MCA 2997]|uniref:Homeobox domain-containing protein n=2 Tax=Moniliophthora roreri TaxID=221103 RepID=V2X7V3_MONRO|nr:hypothetical protein Moror_4011 [Moniliophthora roreri MCA 2997]